MLGICVDRGAVFRFVLPMTNEQRFDAIAKALMEIRRDSLRTIARGRALEVMVMESIPAEDKDNWHKRLNDLTKAELQRLFEEFEKQNPGFAALLDDREPWEWSAEP